MTKKELKQIIREELEQGSYNYRSRIYGLCDEILERIYVVEDPGLIKKIHDKLEWAVFQIESYATGKQGDT